MSGSDIGYAGTRAGGLGVNEGALRSAAQVCYAILLRVPSAMSGTDLYYYAILLRVLSAMSSTDLQRMLLSAYARSAVCGAEQRAVLIAATACLYWESRPRY
eukprot:1130852-Rhodomonas_salina.1